MSFRVALVGLGRLALAIVAAVAVGAALAAPGSDSALAQATDKDCDDFATQAAAQDYFIARGGPAQDPDRLDADGNGIACQTLPCPCNSGSTPSTGAPPAPTPTPTPTPTPPPSPARPADEPLPEAPTRRAARITSVVDGDTVKVRLRSGRRLTVRLIGIDTPETKRPGVAVECGGRAASTHMRRIAFKRGRGRAVTLVSDPSQDAKDRYGRTLAYVDARGSGDLGRRMLRAGWATVYVFETPFARLDRYESASAAAESRSAGVWGACRGDFHRPAQ
jgi:endonuclease YncB( thermonuclease family)